jgi:hypothetical protein
VTNKIHPSIAAKIKKTALTITTEIPHYIYRYSASTCEPQYNYNILPFCLPCQCMCSSTVILSQTVSNCQCDVLSNIVNSLKYYEFVGFNNNSRGDNQIFKYLELHHVNTSARISYQAFLQFTKKASRQKIKTCWQLVWE